MDGTTSYWNEASEKLYGYTANEAIGRNLLDLIIPEEMREGVTQAIRQMAETGQPIPASELSLLKKDGSRVAVFSSHAIVRLPGQPAELFCLDIDLTERKATEAALRESEFRWKFAIEGSGDGLWDLDAPTGVVYYSPRWKEMLGYAEHEIGGSLDEWEKRIHPDDKERVMAAARAHRDGLTELYLVEHRFGCKDGSWKWIRARGVVVGRDAAGKPLRVIGTHTDITSRKLADAAIAALALRHQTLLQTASDGIHVLNDQGDVVEANESFCRMLGYSREELLQLNVADWDALATREMLVARIGQLLTHDAVFETRHRRKDGTLRDVEIHSTGVTLEGRNYLYASARDVTGRKQAEADRVKLLAQSQQLQKAESLGRMAGAVAHHFNNQLQAVMLRLELAIHDLPHDREPNESLTEALKSARKAAEVSTQMLTYLGQSFEKIEPLNLTEICHRTLPYLHASMPRTAALETNFPTPGPSINANLNQIQQVLANLVTNAWEAGADKETTIRLSIQTVPATHIRPGNRFPLNWQPQDPVYAALEIADNGSGIVADDIEKLFDPFYSSKFPGRGLGLPVVLGITRALNGVVTVESEPGRGSIFRVYLPALTENHSEDSAPISE